MTIFKTFLFITSFLISWLIYKKKIPFLKKFLIDKPGHRSSHITEKPTGGGIIFILVFIILNSFLLFAGVKNIYLLIPFICLPLAVTGFIDDFMGLSNKIRFFFQLLISILLVIFSHLINLDNNFILFILLVIIATSFINISNFMDGIDGLVAGCMLITFITAAILQKEFFSLWILIGAL